MEGWKFWWGIAAFFLGGLSTQLNGWLTYRRQRKDKADDAADALRQRREEFELQHLVEVNQLLLDYVDGVVHAIGYQLALDRLGDNEDIETELLDAYAKFSAADAGLSAQIGFILDDRVRELVRKAAAELGELPETDGSGDLSLPDMARLSMATRAAFDALSSRVRDLYAGRDHGM